MKFESPTIPDRASPFATTPAEPVAPDGFKSKTPPREHGKWIAAQSRVKFTDEKPLPTTPGTRRLKHLTREEQRPLEVRLNYCRIRRMTDAEASAAIDVHIDDLDALAATYGQP